jgi:hypothetical protein
MARQQTLLQLLQFRIAVSCDTMVAKGGLKFAPLEARKSIA